MRRVEVVTSVVLAGLLIAGLVFREELVAWFRAEPQPADETSESEAHESAPGTADQVSPHRFSDDAQSHLNEALAAYEEARAALASDLRPDATLVARFTRAMERLAEHAPASLAALARSASQERLDAADLEVVRERFGSWSRPLAYALRADPRLAEGRVLFHCPMARAFPRWIQDADTPMANPYMGTRMLQCGYRVDLAETETPDNSPVAYYTCGMHPSVHHDTVGACPICGMDLTPVTEREVETGVLSIDEARRERSGFALSRAARVPLEVSVRAVGRVVVDERKLRDVSLRMSGFVRRLNVDELGQRVRRNQTLMTIYSPELYAAQLEYLTALRSRAFRKQASAVRENPLAAAARQRLVLLGMSPRQVTRIAERGEASENVPIISTVAGYVIEKNVVRGGHVEAGERVFRIADLSEVWVEAEVNERDIPQVAVGQAVRVSVGGREREGRVSFVAPRLTETRAMKVRVELDNADLALRPDMVANVSFAREIGSPLSVPESAVMVTGDRRVVFVDVGRGRVEPREIEVAGRTNGRVVVTSGLEEGDEVVSSGTFLIASESRLRTPRLWDDAP